LHDLGKVGIPERILLKPGKLTKHERDVIKEHPQIGVDIIRPLAYVEQKDIVLFSKPSAYPYFLCSLKPKIFSFSSRYVTKRDVRNICLI